MPYFGGIRQPSMRCTTLNCTTLYYFNIPFFVGGGGGVKSKSKIARWGGGSAKSVMGCHWWMGVGEGSVHPK